MRVVNGSLVVCLSEYLPLRSVYILVIKLSFAERPRSTRVVFQKMLFGPTCCPTCSNHEINCLAYLNRKTKCRNYQ